MSQSFRASMAASYPSFPGMTTSLYPHSLSTPSPSTANTNSSMQSVHIPINEFTAFDDGSVTPYRYSKQQVPLPYAFPRQQDESPLIIKSRSSSSPISATFTDHSADTSYVEHPSRDNSHRSASRIIIAHPYARLYAKKDASKRRKIWNHVLEKQIFSPQELSTMGAPHRRTIYISSLEAHIDRLHNQLLGMGLYPIPFECLEPYRGLNSKTAKSMVAGMQHDATHTKLKLLELERSNNNLRKLLGTQTATSTSISDVRRHSMDASGMGMNARAVINSGSPDSLAYSVTPLSLGAAMR